MRQVARLGDGEALRTGRRTYNTCSSSSFSSASIAKGKGRSGGWGGLGAAFWFGGEIAGFVVGLAAGLEGGSAYILALALAVSGAIFAYIVVRALRSVLPGGAHPLQREPRHVGPTPDPSNPYAPPGAY